mgnify:CR=1 FL=1
MKSLTCLIWDLYYQARRSAALLGPAGDSLPRPEEVR